MIECVYKNGPGIDDHIQVGQRYFKAGGKRSFTKSKDSLHLILPDSFKADVIYLAFNKKNIPKSSFPGTIEVPLSGIAQVSFPENIKTILDGHVDAKIIRSDGNQPVFTYQSSDWLRLQYELKNGGNDQLSIPVPMDSLIVFSSSRFNPSRKYVNKIYQKEVVGNVASFRFSTIRKELTYLGFDASDLSRLYCHD